ncbi:IPO9 [Cordylochernes scorpioides]|uniref:IPO9 n=1 Tax=Cordylochernes scorpioides TaxID=51811 RepID=A0ABY6LIY5_9ARAC|nr:IPO9 [Cordylochernes scorpioides]
MLGCAGPGESSGTPSPAPVHCCTGQRSGVLHTYGLWTKEGRAHFEQQSLSICMSVLQCPQDDSVLPDEPVLDNLIFSLFEFVTVVVEAPRFKTKVKQAMQDLIYYVILFMQITEEQVSSVIFPSLHILLSLFKQIFRSSLVVSTVGKTPPPMDCESSQSGQVDVMAGVTHLKTKMVLGDGSLRYTCYFHSLGMEADTEEPDQGILRRRKHLPEQGEWENIEIKMLCVRQISMWSTNPSNVGIVRSVCVQTLSDEFGPDYIAGLLAAITRHIHEAEEEKNAGSTSWRKKKKVVEVVMWKVLPSSQRPPSDHAVGSVPGSDDGRTVIHGRTVQPGCPGPHPRLHHRLPNYGSRLLSLPREQGHSPGPQCPHETQRRSPAGVNSPESTDQTHPVSLLSGTVPPAGDPSPPLYHPAPSSAGSYGTPGGLISTLHLVERLDRYPLRNKRKIDSVEPEETSMNVKKEGTQVSNYVVQHLPRNPSIFSGEDGEDLQKWLKGYARVARYNHWDETLCLTKVYFYLSGTALKWFENNEESIQTWKEFTSQLENVFGKKENSKLQAEKKLKTRAQLKGESTEFYIQDVLCLCKEADLQMSEEDKTSHLMKGIAEELYQALLPRDVQSTEQFITECRRVEALRCRRVTPTKYERLPNVASLCDQDDGEDLSSLIRKIVREEIQQALDSPHEEPKIAVIEDLVREEIVKTLAPRSKPTISPPQTSRPKSNTRYEAQTIRPHPEPHYRKQGRRCDTNEWRTTEGKPICFYCGRPGHVVRYCRDRKRHNEERRNEYFRRKQDAMEFYNSQTESQEPNDESSRKNFSRYRSPTPYTGRNRQNFSPARRSSWSPRHEI